MIDKDQIHSIGTLSIKLQTNPLCPDGQAFLFNPANVLFDWQTVFNEKSIDYLLVAKTEDDLIKAKSIVKMEFDNANSL